MNNPFEYIPDSLCEEAYRQLLRRLDALKLSALPEDVVLCRELSQGKMLGVLVAADKMGGRHALYAFSGQLGERGFRHSLFVEPVFDYLSPGSYFPTKEAEISQLNSDIEILEGGEYAAVCSELESVARRGDAEIARAKEQYRLAKRRRDGQRRAGVTDDAAMAAMIRASQFEKAEIVRARRRAASSLEPFRAAERAVRQRLEAMKEKRRQESENLQQWLFDNFKVLNAHGESCSLSDIFADTPMGVPPSGAGECCAPKLLQAAYVRGLTPLAMAEYWYGKPKGGELRIHGSHYPACRGKCRPVLGWMLRGLPVEPALESERRAEMLSTPKVLFENQWFCVVEKPAGMLSVPGKGSGRSLQQWLADKWPGRLVKAAHRLDQDTSGLVVATFGEEAFARMQKLFAGREVDKTYEALLEGDYREHGIAPQGCIELPLIPDVLDRPRQRVDFACGKEAVTHYEFKAVERGLSRVSFRPHTGRTHQLRVHAASDQGLGMPIAGDPLYGHANPGGTRRLCLHAHRIEFTFPLDGHHYSFQSPVPF